MQQPIQNNNTDQSLIQVEQLSMAPIINRKCGKGNSYKRFHGFDRIQGTLKSIDLEGLIQSPNKKLLSQRPTEDIFDLENVSIHSTGE